MQQARHIPIRLATEGVSKEQQAQKRNEHEPQVQLHEAERQPDRGEGRGHGKKRLVYDDHIE